MFPSRFFPDRYFPARFFPPVGAEAAAVGGGIYFGSTSIRGIYLGTTAITKVYHGATLVWTNLDPLNMPDATVVAYYNADDYTAGNWPDRTANGYDLTQATGANQPAAIADGGSDFNNKPVVRFGADDNVFRATTPSISQPVTVLVIAKCTSSGGTRVVFDSRDTDNRGCALSWNNSDTIQMFAGSSLIVGSSGINVPLLIEGFGSGASSALRANSVAEASGNAGSESLVGITVGSQFNDVSFFQGDIRAIIVVEGALTAADREYIAIWAAADCGVGAFATPSIDQYSEDAGADGNHSHSFSAPASGDHIIAVGYSTDTGFVTPTDFTDVYHKTITTWSGGFALTIDVFVKESDGTETSLTMAPSGLTSSLDATASQVLVVSGLAAGNPFDVMGENDVEPGTLDSLALALASATSQRVSLVTAFAAFRDGDVTAFSFSDLGDTHDNSAIQDGGANFSLAGLMAADVKELSAAHSSTLSVTATSGGEELMGVILAWNAKAL